MALTFYFGSGSPYAWRAHLALEHKGVAYESKLLSFSKGETRTDAFRALNPRGKVPTLVDDGFVIYESLPVMEYLEERFPDAPALLPPASDVQARATTRRIATEVHTYLGGATTRLGQQVFFRKPEDWDHSRIAEEVKKLTDELGRVEGMLDAQGHFEGGDAPLADYTLYPLLAIHSRMLPRLRDLGLKDVIGPRGKALMARIEALPFYNATYPPHWRE